MYRINQAYVSISVADFHWFDRFNLHPYRDSLEPCLFIGMYREEDHAALKQHKGIAVVKWCGYDSLMTTDFKLFRRKNVRNITVHHNVVRHLRSNGVRVKKIEYYSTDENHYTGISGDAVYAYAPKTSNDYHRRDMIKRLRRHHNILRGSDQFSQDEWHSGAKYGVYNQCYIGLVLNDYAGGLGTILELACQGKYVITNAAKYDNCLPWSTIDDIRAYLSDPKYKQPNKRLADRCNFYNFEPKWLYL
jgi:hypothetical protein